MPEEVVKRIASSLTLATASTIVDGALEAGRNAEMLPLSVAVLDAGGHLIAFKREDGAGLLRFDIAFGKAWAALSMGMTSRTIGVRLKERVAFQAAAAVAAEGRFVPVPGGVQILNDHGEVMGAVGISGDASDKDEYCAIAGIKAAGLTACPADPAADWHTAVP